MSPMGHGYPLWILGPNENLHAEYRKKGVTVGDVVVFTKDGAVDFVFNIFRPANDPIHSHGVPNGFYPQICSDTRRYQHYGEDSYLASKPITKKVEKMGPSGTVFLSSAPEGAILTMPKGEYSEDIAHLSGLDQYVSANLESWYKYVNEVRGWGVEMGKLHLVTGVHKSLAWGMATFSNGPDAGEVRLRFNSRNEPPYGSLYSWEYDGESDCPRVGPTKEQKRSLWENVPFSRIDYPYENQCLFVRTMNATLRTPNAQKATAQTLRQTTHPSEYINKSLLEMRANARTVITHDEEWMSLLTEDDYVFPDNQELFERLISANDIVEKDVTGVISLKRSDRHPMRPTPPPASDAAMTVNVVETVTASRLSFGRSEAESPFSSGTSYATGRYADYGPQMYSGHPSTSTGARTNQFSDVIAAPTHYAPSTSHSTRPAMSSGTLVLDSVTQPYGSTPSYSHSHSSYGQQLPVVTRPTYYQEDHTYTQSDSGAYRSENSRDTFDRNSGQHQSQGPGPDFRWGA
ncbi:hypothetical protein BDN70DRAFT_897933 [Pholiota conissans]|uniref:Uncharacterized protein n=1 Tax=Pholiota conissans TaxID=109636 RepID=A0A9P6CWZ1_9AGAR|nr:hypothetical protein BDN70DRAFT_897933 [Pholiota conissans]